MPRFALLALVIGVVGAIAIAFMTSRTGLIPTSDAPRLIYLLLWLVLVLGGTAVMGRGRLGSFPIALRNAAIWLFILFGAMGIYVVKDQIGAGLTPSAPRAVGDAVELTRANDGHFWADVEINDTHLRMMIDTGATSCALTPRDAARIGLDPTRMAFMLRIATGKGEALAAPASLKDVTLGSIHLTDVEAVVMQDDIDLSVLGMSFLDRLDGYEVRGNKLILHPKP